MDKQSLKDKKRSRRRAGIRRRIRGTAERPRLAVYRSLNHMYAQVIDDLSGRTVAAASTRDAGVTGGGTGNAKGAEAVGATIAQKAKAAGVTRVVFDRGGFRFHGRVKALADAARKNGLEF